MPVGNHYLDKESQENFEGYFDLLINQLNYFIFSKLFGGSKIELFQFMYFNLMLGLLEKELKRRKVKLTWRFLAKSKSFRQVFIPKEVCEIFIALGLFIHTSNMFSLEDFVLES